MVFFWAHLRLTGLTISIFECKLICCAESWNPPQCEVELLMSNPKRRKIENDSSVGKMGFFIPVFFNFFTPISLYYVILIQ